MNCSWPLDSTDEDAAPLPPPWDGVVDLEDKVVESALLPMQYSDPALALRICRVAFDQAEATGDKHAALHALYVACSYLYNNSRYAEADRVFKIVRERAPGVAGPRLSARMQLFHSSRLTEQGEYAQGMILRQKALAAAMALSDDRLTYHALSCLAQSAVNLGDGELTLALLEQQERTLPSDDVLVHTQRSNRLNMLALAWKQIAQARRSAGDAAAGRCGLHNARQFSVKALSAALNERDVLNVLRSLVEILLLLDDPQEARALVDRFRATLHAVLPLDTPSWVTVQHAYAQIDVHVGTVTGQTLQALHVIEALQGDGREIDLVRNDVQETLQAAHESLGHHEQALIHHKQATQTRQKERHSSKVRQRVKLLRHSVFAFRAEAVEFITHDLLTPLAAAQTWVQSLTGERFAPVLSLPPRDAHAHAQLCGAMALCGQYLSLLRAELMPHADLQILDLGALADDVCENASAPGGRHLRLTRDIDIGTLVLGDPSLLAKAIAALLTDAIDRAPTGTPVQLQLRHDDAAADAVLSIHHQGQGPTDAACTRLYQQFIDGKVFDGGELGLALAAKVARLHHARLRIDKLPGQGSTLRFTMKLEPRAPKAATRP